MLTSNPESLELLAGISGPVVWLTGVLHGDEPGGEVVIRRLFEELKKVGLDRGSLHALPIINESGFKRNLRELPETGEDLNRLFPGQVGGTCGQQLAATVWQKIFSTKPDFVLDLHNDWINSLNYILIDDDQAESLALSSGLLVIREDDQSLETMTGALSFNLNQKGIPALTMELGGERIVDEKNVQIGVNAVSRILCRLGLINREIFPDKVDSVNKLTDRVYLYSDYPRPTVSGRVKIMVEAGQTLSAGETLAIIEDSNGKSLEKILSPGSGVVIGFTDEAVAEPGQPVVALGLI